MHSVLRVAWGSHSTLVPSRRRGSVEVSDHSRHGRVKHHVVCSFVLHYTDDMARPRGRTKPARLTVNLDRPTYRSLVELARREDVSVSWVVRRAIEGLLTRDRATPVAPVLGAPRGDGNRAGSGEMAP